MDRSREPSDIRFGPIRAAPAVRGRVALSDLMGIDTSTYVLHDTDTDRALRDMPLEPKYISPRAPLTYKPAAYSCHVVKGELPCRVINHVGNESHDNFSQRCRRTPFVS